MQTLSLTSRLSSFFPFYAPYKPKPKPKHCFLLLLFRRSYYISSNKMGDEKSEPSHVAGDWYSVPELSLRDHRFTVPLDYSRPTKQSPIISVFAREVVTVVATQLRIKLGVDSPVLMKVIGRHFLFVSCIPKGSSVTYLELCRGVYKIVDDVLNLVRKADQEMLRDDSWSSVLLEGQVEGNVYICTFQDYMLKVGKEDQAMPYLLFLQGGPGYEAPRPTESSGWLSKACEEHRVILMDQRGTGLSTPLTTSSMLQMKSAQELVDYLKYFRADNIVNDAELIRKHLVPGEGPWKVLGQSFGGFCGVTYLSLAPQGLKDVFLTGGIPPIGDGCTAEAVYNASIGPIVLQNEKYYKRYPQDIKIIRDVVNYLAESEGGGVPLPSGGILTPRSLQLLGLTGLGSSTGFERLHYLFERVWDPVIVLGAKKQISYYFLNAFEKWLSFDTNPLYALMHESIYCQGAASQWAAHRVRAKHESKLDPVKAAKEGRPVFLTGEMVFPWMFDEIHALRPFKEAANLLAEKKDWPPLYDKTQLNYNKVPVAAAVYYEDMFVNFNLSMETAAQIAGIRLWVTNEYMHSGLRDGAGHVLDHLMGLLNGKKPLF